MYVLRTCSISVCVLYLCISAAKNRSRCRHGLYLITKSAKALLLCVVIACKASCMPFRSSSGNSSLFCSHLALVLTKDWWTHLEALPTSFFQAVTLSLAAFRAAFAASSSLPHLAALFPGCFATAASPSLGILQTSSSWIGMALPAVVAAVVLSGCADFPFFSLAFFKAYSFSANSFSTLPWISSSSMTSLGAAQVSPHTWGCRRG